MSVRAYALDDPQSMSVRAYALDDQDSMSLRVQQQLVEAFAGY